MKWNKPTIKLLKQDSSTTSFSLSGHWNYELPKSLLRELKKSLKTIRGNVCIYFEEDFVLDFSGGRVLVDWATLLEQKNHKIIFYYENKHSYVENILKILKDTPVDEPTHETTITKNIWLAHLDTFKILQNYLNGVLHFLSFVGECLYTLFSTLIHPLSIRIRATLFHIQESLIKAVPITALAAFLIGIVIAYQGALQLQQFGASFLIVEMASMLTLRELGPIITAIIVAGRSASSFSAEIGVMKLTQEVSAMKTLGFNPVTFLVLPRIIALCFILPLVIFIADLFGIAGAMMICNLQLNISNEQFIQRFSEMVELRHFIVGMIKAPFFGLIIAIIGCYRGFVISSDTRSVGKYTTKSVVESIFCVIAFDAICSVIFTQLGY